MIDEGSRGVRLHPVEIDLLCTFAEVAAPFPLEIPSSGQTTTEQLMIYRGAREALTERGLADEGGPLGVAEDFVHLIRFGTGALDMVVNEREPQLSAVVLADRGEALLVTQAPPSESGELGYVYLKPLTLDEAVDDLVRLVPRHGAPMAPPFMLPRRAIGAVFQVLAERYGDPEQDVPPREMTADEVDELVRAQGIDDRVIRNMVSHLQPVLGNGQAGIARRAGDGDEWRRDGDELRWLDTPKGRYRLADSDETGSPARPPRRPADEEDTDEFAGSDWISVNPFTPDEFRAALRKLAARLR